MGFTIIKQYLNKDVKILFLYIKDKKNYLYVRPIEETRAYENISSSLYIDDNFFEKMKITNQKLDSNYKINKFLIPYINDFSFEKDDLIIYNKNKLFIELYTKIIYHLKTKKFEIKIDSKEFSLFYNKILDIYRKNKYLIVDFTTLIVEDQEMLDKLNFLLTNEITLKENIIFKNEIDMFDKNILMNKPQIKNIYFTTLQDLDLYYYFNKDLFTVTRSTSNKNAELSTILENGTGYHNGFYFRRIE